MCASCMISLPEGNLIKYLSHKRFAEIEELICFDYPGIVKMIGTYLAPSTQCPLNKTILTTYFFLLIVLSEFIIFK